MNIINSIKNFISRTGQNPDFVAFMAHTGFTSFVISHWGKHTAVLVITIIIAAIKEFWYDLHFETSPTQTLRDSTWDFAGYMAGVGMGLLSVYNVYSYFF